MNTDYISYKGFLILAEYGLDGYGWVIFHDGEVMDECLPWERLDNEDQSVLAAKRVIDVWV